MPVQVEPVLFSFENIKHIELLVNLRFDNLDVFPVIIAIGVILFIVIFAVIFYVLWMIMHDGIGEDAE